MMSVGFAVLIAAGCFGYLLAMLQRRGGAVVYSQDVSYFVLHITFTYTLIVLILMEY